MRDTLNDGRIGVVPGTRVRGKYEGAPLVLVGLENISRAVGAGTATLKRWIRDGSFPARRCTDGIYRADPDAIRLWFHPPYSGRKNPDKVWSATTWHSGYDRTIADC